MIRYIEKINQKPEKYRNRLAFGLSLALSVFIFSIWALHGGYINIGKSKTLAEEKSTNQMASTISATSPLQSSKQSFKAAFEEIGDQYQKFKESISSVLVPFVSGIDVYERK